ncbi:hypothetical protein ACFU6K_05430 [Kitasatospora sp. NPDC057512]|uniref:hypothetical protein n=1 Tax=Kitasatospora sp. NPDC057512 TaxID=3346154 RepID=UPI0036B9ED37
MRLVLDGVSEDLARELFALLGRHGAAPVLQDAQWTVTRAAQLLRDLPATAVQIIRLAAEGEGWVASDHLRGPDGSESLRGRSGAITKAVNRGAAKKRWPVGMPLPVEAQYDPENPSYQRTTGYVMNEDLVPVFKAALTRIDRETAELAAATVTAEGGA